MPINVDAVIEEFDEREFHELAYKFMGVVFAVRNRFGRLLEETVYQQKILAEFRESGIASARREVKIEVSHADYTKSYFLDFLLANGVIVETKACEALTGAHHAQVLQYLMLAGLHHGLLVNLRPPDVEKRFVSTTLTPQERQRYEVDDTNWTPMNEASIRLHILFLDLIEDWGLFLQISLYRDALGHFFSGPSTGLVRIPIVDDDRELGHQQVCMLSQDTMVALTAIKNPNAEFSNHLRKFLLLTRLNFIQWINMNNHKIEFRTLTRE